MKKILATLALMAAIAVQGASINYNYTKLAVTNNIVLDEISYDTNTVIDLGSLGGGPYKSFSVDYSIAASGGATGNTNVFTSLWQCSNDKIRWVDMHYVKSLIKASATTTFSADIPGDGHRYWRIYYNKYAAPFSWHTGSSYVSNIVVGATMIEDVIPLKLPKVTTATVAWAGYTNNISTSVYDTVQLTNDTTTTTLGLPVTGWDKFGVVITGVNHFTGTNDVEFYLSRLINGTTYYESGEKIVIKRGSLSFPIVQSTTLHGAGVFPVGDSTLVKINRCVERDALALFTNVAVKVYMSK